MKQRLGFALRTVELVGTLGRYVSSVFRVGCAVTVAVMAPLNTVLLILAGRFSDILGWVLLSIVFLIASGFLLISGIGLSWAHKQQGPARWAEPVVAFAAAAILLAHVLGRRFFAGASLNDGMVIELEIAVSLVLTGIVFIRRVPRRLFDFLDSLESK